MKEQDYVNVSNLARVSCAISAVRDTSVRQGEEMIKCREIMRMLMEWRDELYGKVKVG